ncbi:MAG TPA: sulfur carrier protein ThiS [Sedimentisphaerales bacterium]|nr:sulfur carrier protein ThiS [Sedimentisphaerales bacterium]
MKLTVNGREGDFSENLTVSRLLVEQQVKMPEMVSVEINGQILKRAEFEQRILEEGDKVEFLYFMGGGEKKFGGITDFWFSSKKVGE